MPVVIRALTPADDRSRFESGDIELDRFFRRFAGQNQFRHHTGVTYVAAEGSTLLGFVTVAAASIETTHLPATTRNRLPSYPLPVLRVARLAVDGHVKGQGIGVALLRYALLLAHEMAGKLGCVGVVVDAKPDAVSFYARLGFVPLDAEGGRLRDLPAPRPMFVELGAIPKI
ncbi:MAG TPA: GNAT family N-acetyltransferase [Thermoanaerobaculia bacterium]|nr:GNAT family N-acetyltransferase [Thermoanaerobaculia bacterium]